MTEHLSKVLANISAHIAATEIGLPLIDPELSIKIVTKVSLKSVSFSFLKDNEFNGSIITRVNLDVSRTPSSKSKFHDLFCFAKSFLCNLFANLDTKLFNCKSCWSKFILSLSNSSLLSKLSALITSSNSSEYTRYFLLFSEKIVFGLRSVLLPDSSISSILFSSFPDISFVSGGLESIESS